MPNHDNVHAPVCLVGPGRSGTTLITNIFRRHPDCQSLGETANLIFSTYYHIERALPLCGPRARGDTVEEAARLAVHGMLFKLYRSRKAFWFHKPILLPSVQTFFSDEAEFGDWYWSRAAILFPEARYFAVLRDPHDVAVSSMTRWGWNTKAANRNLSRTYGLLLHPKSRLSFAIDFDDLTRDAEASTRRLLDFAGVPFDKSCLDAFDRQHAPNDEEVRRGIENHHDAKQILNEDVLERFALLKKRWAKVASC